MPRGKRNKTSDATDLKSCVICVSEIEKEEATSYLLCKKFVHRYCTGVPLEEFRQNDGRFTCSTCLRKQHEVEMAELGDVVTALKAGVSDIDGWR